MSFFARRMQAAVAPVASGGTIESPSKVLIIIEENHSLAQMESGMPYLYGLAQTYAYATDYQATTHPSEPNYIAIAGGDTFGITTDDAPSVNAPKVGDAMSVFDQALAKGKTAKTYCQSMTTNNQQTSSGTYAVKHNPWAYFHSYMTNADQYDIPYATNFATDVAANNLPNVGMLIPDLDHDAHDGTLAQADTWLQSFMPGVLQSTDFSSGKLAVVVTADEDDKQSGNIVLTTVFHASLSSKVVGTHLTHYSLSAYCSQLSGSTPLLNAASAPSFANAFGL